MHDIYYGTRLPPYRAPLQVTRPMQRIGDPYLRVDPDKVVAIVETDAPDRNTPLNPPDEASTAMAGLLVDFLRHEVAAGRMPPGLLPLQSGVGNVANAVMAGLLDSEFGNLTAFTEVIQDGCSTCSTAASWWRPRPPPSGSPRSASDGSSTTSAPTRAGSCCAARRSPTTRSWSVASA